MLEPPSSQRGWILLIIAVLVASTIVTATLGAVLTKVLFPDGFLVDVQEAEEPRPVQAPPAADPVEPAPSGFRLQASISCSVLFGDVEDVGGRK